MEKETKPSSSFMVDFLTRAWAVCSSSADALGLCSRTLLQVNAWDMGGKGLRHRKALGRGKQGSGTRDGLPWAFHARSAHIKLPMETRSLCPGC